MSKLTALARVTATAGGKVVGVKWNTPGLASRIGSAHLGEKAAKILPYAVGAYKGYAGAKHALNHGQHMFHSLDDNQQEKYKTAYGSNAANVYAKKQAIKHGILGAVEGYHMTHTALEVAHGIHGFLNSTPQRERKSMFKKVHPNYTNVEKIKLLKMQAHDYIRQNGANLVKGQIKSYVKSKALDAAIEHGPAGIYGEVAKYAHKLRNKQGRISNSKSKKQH